MRTKRPIKALIATAAISGGLIAVTAVAPAEFHDMSNPAASDKTAAVESVITPNTAPDEFHDM